MKKIILFILMLFVPFMINAEEIKLKSQKSWGGNGWDSFNSIISTNDGGYILFGLSDSTDIDGITNKGRDDIVIIKYDKDFNVVWQKDWGGNHQEHIHNILKLEDGGFVVAGVTVSTDLEGVSKDSDTTAILLRYDKEGNLLWNNFFGGHSTSSEVPIFQTEDGGFIVLTPFSSTTVEGIPNMGEWDLLIVKYDKDGNVVWKKSYGGNGTDNFRKMIPTEDGGFYVFGDSDSTDITGFTTYGGSDIVTMKYDKDGNLIWKKNYGGNGDDAFRNVILTEDGSFILTGLSKSTDLDGWTNKGAFDILIIKHDKDGNLIWEKSHGGKNTDNYHNIAAIENGFIVYGLSISTDIVDLPNKGSADTIILRYDNDGNLIWQKDWGGNGGDILSNVFITKNGEILLLGSTSSKDINGIELKGITDGVIVKYDKDGNLLWQKSYGGSNRDNFSFIMPNDDGSLMIIGNSTSTDIDGFSTKGSDDIVMLNYLIEYNLENITSQSGTSTVIQQGKYGVITPTPNEGYEVDKIIVKDKDGNVLDVETTKQEDGTYSFELNDDVTIEVLFKEKLENPKTGMSDIIGLMFTVALCFISGFFVLKNYNKNYEL